IVSFNAKWPLDLQTWPGLEAQAAALSDDIAYVNHDIDDGLRAGLFGVEELATAPLAGPHVQDVQKRHPNLETGRFIGAMVSGVMSDVIGDGLTETAGRIRAARPEAAANVRAHGRALVAFSPAMEQGVAALKSFLSARMYKHPRVLSVMTSAKAVI